MAVCLVAAITANSASAHVAGLSRLGGWVYIDRNNDGSLAFSSDPDPEYVIGEVRIDLLSKVGNVETLMGTAQSDDFGRYLFEDLSPGTYVLRETQSVMYVDGIDTIGTLLSLDGQPILGAASIGTMTNDAHSDIVLTADVIGEFYNFGERGLTAGYVSKRFLLASYPAPPSTPPPPVTSSFPEPTTLALAVAAAFGSWLIPSRRRRS